MFDQRQSIVPALLSALLVAGCGGASTEVAETAPVAQSAATPAAVRLEGCVVDAAWSGAAGAAVHVRTAAGRAVGTVFTDERGVFAVNVPARTAILVDTVADGAGGLELQTGAGPLTLGACLLSNL